MIIKNNFNNYKIDYLQKEKDSIRKSVTKLDEKFKKGEIDREKFLKQNSEFAKRQEDLTKKINRLK